MKICGIYKITNPTGKIYIGQSSDCNVRERIYRNYKGNDTSLIGYSIRKYGWDQHKFEVIHKCNLEELDTWEIHFITLYDTLLTRHGLNLKPGGSIGAGYKFTDEQRKQRSQQLRGENNPMYGKHNSPEAIEKIRAKTKGVAKSEVARKNINTNHFRKPIAQYTRSRIFIRNWSSAKEASDSTGLNHAVILRVCDGKGHSCGGYHWKHQEQV